MDAEQEKEWAEAIERNVAAAPPFTTETLEKLAVVLGPAVARVTRERRRRAARSPK